MTIAILDPDQETTTLIAEFLSERGHKVAPFTSKNKFLEVINPQEHQLAIIADDYADVIEGTKQVYPHIEILATGTDSRTDCIAAGASHYLAKPFRAQELESALEILSRPTSRPAPETSFITRDAHMQHIVKIIRKVAPTQAPVFIQGESGCGKEVLAREIHRLSKRASHPYVGINLAAIPETLLESELFGYEKGAFTGAYAARAGKFEMAHEGTILLDEITEINLGLQTKLLRVLQERQIDRVGGKEPVSCDFRVIATTNRDIEEEVREGRFRQDLFFRLNVIPVKIPPLRNRREDILPLAEHFIAKISAREQMAEKTLSDEAKAALLSHPWPGNVRELENVIERALILSDGSTLAGEDLMIGIEGFHTAETHVQSGTTIHEMERRLILSTLDDVSGNRTRAAELLGISIRTLRNKLNEYSGKGQISDALAGIADTDTP